MSQSTPRTLIPFTLAKVGGVGTDQRVGRGVHLGEL
jgi:hypothetical protein